EPGPLSRARAPGGGCHQPAGSGRDRGPPRRIAGAARGAHAGKRGRRAGAPRLQPPRRRAVRGHAGPGAGARARPRGCRHRVGPQRHRAGTGGERAHRGGGPPGRGRVAAGPGPLRRGGGAGRRGLEAAVRRARGALALRGRRRAGRPDPRRGAGGCAGAGGGPGSDPGGAGRGDAHRRAGRAPGDPAARRTRLDHHRRAADPHLARAGAEARPRAGAGRPRASPVRLEAGPRRRGLRAGARRPEEAEPPERPAAGDGAGAPRGQVPVDGAGGASGRFVRTVGHPCRAARPGAHQARGEGDSLAVRLFTAIFLLMLGVALVSTGLVGLLVLSDTRELLTRDAQELAAERVAQVSLKASAALDAPVRATTALARVPGFLSLPQAERRAHLAAVLTERRDLTAVTVFSARGERFPGLQAFAVKDLPPTEVAEHEARARALLGPGTETVRWSRATILPGRPPSITFVFPRGDPARGYVAAELSLAGLGRALEAEHVGSTGFAYVVDAD